MSSLRFALNYNRVGSSHMLFAGSFAIPEETVCVTPYNDVNVLSYLFRHLSVKKDKWDLVFPVIFISQTNMYLLRAGI